jgi:hypothetical protein
MAAVLSANYYNPADLQARGIGSLPGQACAVKGSGQADGRGAAFYSAADIKPFSGNGFIFAHNGVLEIPAEIKTTLGKYEKLVKGVNGPQILFWQIMKMLDAYGDPALALEMAVEETKTVWFSVKGRYPGKKAPYRGLNIFLSDGGALWVLSHYQAGAKNEALMPRGWESGQIAWKKDDQKIIFLSEPPDDGPWRTMSDLQIAEARLNGGGVTLKIKTLERSYI